jgi:hypothetical protein
MTNATHEMNRTCRSDWQDVIHSHQTATNVIQQKVATFTTTSLLAFGNDGSTNSHRNANLRHAAVERGCARDRVRTGCSSDFACVVKGARGKERGWGKVEDCNVWQRCVVKGARGKERRWGEVEGCNAWQRTRTSSTLTGVRLSLDRHSCAAPGSG